MLLSARGTNPTRGLEEFQVIYPAIARVIGPLPCRAKQTQPRPVHKFQNLLHRKCNNFPPLPAKTPRNSLTRPATLKLRVGATPGPFPTVSCRPACVASRWLFLGSIPIQ